MAGPIRISILANASKAKGEINGVGKEAESSVNRAKSALKGLATGFIAFEALSKVKDVLRDSISEAREAQKINAQTGAVIKSTGGAANVSAEHVHSYADALGRATGQNADLIQSSENILLTFKGVQNQVGKGNHIFDRATQTVTDMSVALGQSGKAGAIQLGKALNDPIKGVTALARVGVTFTAQQKKQIASMVSSGHTMGAQKIILKELSSEFGGSAKAQATAGDRMKETFREVEEEIGKKLLPILDTVETYIADHLPEWFAKAETAVDKVKSGFEDVQPYIETVINFLKKNPDTIKTFGIVLGALVTPIALVAGAMAALDAILAVNPFVLLAVGIAAVAAGLVYAYQHSKTFKAIVDDTFGAIKTIVTTVIPAVVGFVKQHWALLLPLLGGPVGLAAVLIIKNFDKIITAIKLVGQWGKWLWTTIFQPVFSFIVKGISLVLTIFSKLAHSFSWLPIVGHKFDAFGDALDKVIDKANGVSSSLNHIPKKTTATVVLNVVEGVVHTTGGRVPLDPRGTTNPRSLIPPTRKTTQKVYQISVTAPMVAPADYDAGEQIVAAIRAFEAAGGVA